MRKRELDALNYQAWALVTTLGFRTTAAARGISEAALWQETYEQLDSDQILAGALDCGIEQLAQRLGIAAADLDHWLSDIAEFGEPWNVPDNLFRRDQLRAVRKEIEAEPAA